MNKKLFINMKINLLTVINILEILKIHEKLFTSKHKTLCFFKLQLLQNVVKPWAFANIFFLILFEEIYFFFIYSYKCLEHTKISSKRNFKN